MRIQSIGANFNQSKPKFKGKYEHLVAKEVSPGDGVSYRLVTYLAPNIDYTETIKNSERERANVMVERTIDSFHTRSTDLIYYAAPLEDVSDRERVNADYIVYDLEPKMPKVEGEVSENYFGTQRINYGLEYYKVQSYFYRLEMETQGKVDDIRRRMYAGIAVDNGQNLLHEYEERIAYCKKMQKDIQKARDIYHSANWIRATKEWFEDLIDKSNELLAKNAIKLEQAKTDLKVANENKKNCLYQKSLTEQKLANYKKINEINKRLEDDFNSDSDEEIAYKIRKNEKLISNLENYIKDCNTVIQEAKHYIIAYPQNVARIKNEIKEYLGKIEKVKSDLIPMFDKLKNHCIKHGIRG